MTTVQKLPSHESHSLPPSAAERDRLTIELIARATPRGARDPRDPVVALAKAVELNMPLARSLASRYQRRGVPTEDLQQVAYVGLLKAIRGFSPDHAASFAAYAIPTIRGELRRYFRDFGWTVRPPRRIQEVRARMRDAEAELTQPLGRIPSASEVADHLDLHVGDVLEASSVSTCYLPQSLDAPVTSDDSLALDPGLDDPGFARAEARTLVEGALRDLGPRDRLVLDLRFVHDLTQREIGQAIGVTQMQVSRILARILDEMRSSILDEAV